MTNILRISVFLFFIILSYLGFQNYPSQAADDEVRERFLRGALIFRPHLNMDEGRVVMRIADLENPLAGTFNLAHCGDERNYLSISTGYRRGIIQKNAGKVEIWIAPRFLIKEALDTTATHFQPIMDNWQEESQVGLFWTWGGSDSLLDYDYLTQSMDEISNGELDTKQYRWNGRRLGSGGKSQGVTVGLAKQCAAHFHFVFPK